MKRAKNPHKAGDAPKEERIGADAGEPAPAQCTAAGEGEPIQSDGHFAESDKIASLKSALAEKSKLCEDYLDTLKRLQADFENYKKRAHIEKEDIVRYANEGLLQRMLFILDSFEAALSGLEKEKPSDAKASKLYDGVRMIYDNWRAALKQEGVSQIEAVGRQFDPYWHEALMTKDAPGVEENTVLEEVQKGYMYRSRVLRSAKVIVSAKADAKKQAEDGSQESPKKEESPNRKDDDGEK